MFADAKIRTRHSTSPRVHWRIIIVPTTRSQAART